MLLKHREKRDAAAIKAIDEALQKKNEETVETLTKFLGSWNTIGVRIHALHALALINHSTVDSIIAIGNFFCASSDPQLNKVAYETLVCVGHPEHLNLLLIDECAKVRVATLYALSDQEENENEAPPVSRSHAAE